MPRWNTGREKQRALAAILGQVSEWSINAEPSRVIGSYEMRAFEVYLNKKRLCVVGVGEDGVLSTILTHVIGNGRDEVDLHVGGLVCPENEHLTWKRVTLRTGDEVRVRVVKSTVIDKPRKRYRQDAAADKKNLKRYVRKMARELGWQVSAKKST